MIHQGDPGKIDKLAAEALAPGHFFIRRDMALLWERLTREEIAWEVSRGRLVPARFARHVRCFTSWNVYHVEAGLRSTSPILSLKFDAQNRQLHVVRAILSHVWEALDTGGNVIDSRETTAWVAELVGTIQLAEYPSGTEDALREELERLLGAAVVGTSRLPLTSLESPLPGFSLGHLAYAASATGASPMRSSRELLERWQDSAPSDVTASARLLEAGLRAASAAEISELAGLLRLERRVLMAHLRALFNDVSLSPWTNLADNILSFLQCLVSQGSLEVDDEIDLLGGLLLQLGRHLTAYDLSTYHHRGANYPDALLLDVCCKRYLLLCESHAGRFLGEEIKQRRRRRALRQGWRLRAHYEGHYVPDAPTSPGENARVLPPPFIRVPEEQLLHPGKRRRRLYDGDPIADQVGPHGRAILEQSIRDLVHADEWRELGLAVFIDRPLGAGKAVGEPDQTPLLSYLAFSQAIAATRLVEIGTLASGLGLERSADRLPSLPAAPVRGLPLDDIQPTATGIVSLADVRRVSEDFLLLRTLPTSVRQFLDAFDWQPVADVLDVARAFDHCLIVPVKASDNGPALAVLDADLNRVLEMTVNLSAGYQVRRGVETPRAGLIVRYAGREVNVRGR